MKTLVAYFSISGNTAAKLCPSLKGAESLTAVLVKSADDLKP